MRPDRHKKTIAPRAVRSPIPGRAVRLAPWFLTLMAAAATTGTRAERLRFDPSLPWEVRRAQPADVILADSPAAWHVQFVNARAPEVRITDNPAGDYRGHVLLGKTVTLPDHVPYHVGLRFRYQTYCALPDRSGQVAFFVFTTRAWDGLGDDPLTRVQFDPSRPPTGVVASAIVHAHGDPVGDCTSWQLYESANLSRDLSDHAGEKVVFAVLWGCYHRGASEWGRLADVQLVTRTREEALERLRARIYSPEFFSHFMLRGKDLAAVKAAVVEGDYLTAGEELVAHFAKRTAPRWHFGRADRPRPTFPAVADGPHAFRALGGGFGLTDRRFGAGSDAQGMGYGDRESCLWALARAYWTTADEKYAREFAAGFVDWYLSRPPSAGGPSWDPDEAAVRVPELISCFHYLQDSDGADGFLRLVMLQSLWEHGQFTLAHKTVDSNAILVQVNALLALASVFPEYQDARTWRDVGNKWLVDALKKQFYPDGACVELSGARQAACLAALHDIRATAALNRVSLPREFTPTMLRATEALMFLMKPDGSVPSTNAGTADAVTEWLSKGGEIFKRDDMKWLASAERKGAPPPAPSESLPYAGWVVMRTGWNPGDRYLFFDAGPYGQGGQHEDGLSIEVYAFGRTLVADPGGADGGDEWGKYFSATGSHSTVTVDGYGQRRRDLSGEWLADEPLEDVRFMTSACLDYAEGTYADGYGPGGRIPAAHTRKIVFVRPDYWLLFDIVRGSGEHTVSSQFQLTPSRAIVDLTTMTVRTDSLEGNLLIRPVVPKGLGVNVACGEKAPLRGWMCSGASRAPRPAPLVTYARRAELPTVLALLLCPYEREPPRVLVRDLSVESEDGPVDDLEAQGVEVRIGERADAILISHDPPVLRRYGPFEFDGELALLTREEGGQWEVRFSQHGALLRALAPTARDRLRDPSSRESAR